MASVDTGASVAGAAHKHGDARMMQQQAELPHRQSIHDNKHLRFHNEMVPAISLWQAPKTVNAHTMQQQTDLPHREGVRVHNSGLHNLLAREDSPGHCIHI